MSKVAIITGITGQDGSYLAELLISKGYKVIGTTRGNSDISNIKTIFSQIELVNGDIANKQFVKNLISQYQPDEVYNLASVSNIIQPWNDISNLVQATAMAPLYILEAIVESGCHTRFFQASSAQMYGVVGDGGQDEQTSFKPTLPYGIAKLFVHNFIEQLRINKKIYAVSGILFNHESPRRGSDFLTKKVVRELCNIKKGKQEILYLGNLDASRDWGYAKDYVEAMWLMLQQDTPKDYVIGTGETHTVREFVECAATKLGLHITWKGEGLEEVGVDQDGRTIVIIDEKFYRKNDTAVSFARPQKLFNDLQWKPTTDFKSLVDLMVEAEYHNEI